MHLPVEFHILLVELSLLSPRVLWDEHGFDIGVQLVEQDIAEDRTCNRALWHATERPIEFPVLQISRIEQLFHEVEKASVVNVLTQH